MREHPEPAVAESECGCEYTFTREGAAAIQGTCTAPMGVRSNDNSANLDQLITEDGYLKVAG